LVENGNRKYKFIGLRKRFFEQGFGEL